MNKKIIFSCLAVLILMACGKESEEVETSNNNLSGHLITEEPLEMTIHLHYGNKWHWDENSPAASEAARQTNVKMINTTSTTGTDSTEIFNIMMVSGKLPDVVGGDKRMSDYIKYGMEGAFIPLNDLIEEHAPDVKRFLEEHPRIKAGITAPDGNIYFLPYVPDGGVSRGYWIRQDWLDTLGLKTPTTIDELYDTMVAFRDKDPNGNGLKDEVPMIFREWTEMIRMATLFGARTAGTDKPNEPASFYIKENGQVAQGWTEPEFKEGMKHIVKWYNEGLIDPEVFTRGRNTREVMFTADLAGFTRDWMASTAKFNKVLADKIPGFNLQPMLPPVNVNGEVFEENQRALFKPDGWAITHVNKHPVETIKYFNFYFTEDGRRLNNFGVEGIHYDMVDGKPQFKEEMLTASKPVNDRLKDDGAQFPIGFHMDYEYERQWSDEVAVNGNKLYKENVTYPIEFILPTLTPEEQKLYESKWPAIQTYMEETVQNWILQNKDVDKEWDNYLQTLEELGLGELLEIIQKASDRANKNI